MMQRDGPGNEADAGEENIIRSDDYRREKNEMEKKKNPAPRRGVSLFFLEFVVSSVLCR